MADPKVSLADETIQLEAQMASKRATWDTLWQDISELVMPSKSDIIEEKTPDISGWTRGIHDITAIQANQKLAAGSFDFLVSGKWFTYAPPEEHKEAIGKDGGKWYRECGEITLRELNKSNWALEIHEVFLDRGGFGTAALLTEENKAKTGLRFTTQPLGCYSIDEDDEKMVDTFIKTLKMTARNMVKKYGETNVGKTVREAFAKGPKGWDKEFPVIHRISPREDVRAGPKRPDQKPWASIHIDKENKKILLNSGFDEQAISVTRFLRWGKHPYGFCPSIMAMPITRSVNLLEKYMDALAEMAAFPRILIPSNLEGNVDLRSSGVTIFDPNNPAGMPKEWATEGRYDIGKDRAEVMREFINDAYHVELFQALADRSKQMTATEVLELKEEKLVNFSPTFARLQQEIFNPVLSRVFNILFRQGKFPPAPESVMAQTQGGESGILLPEVALTSKLALAMKALENKNFLEFLQMGEMLFALQPEAADWIHQDSILKLAENAGVAEGFINDQETVDEIREGRAKQEQAAAALNAAQQGAQTAKDMSQADPAMQEAVAAGQA